MILNQLTSLGIQVPDIKYQLSVPEMVEELLVNKEGVIAESGAICIDTGQFTGRSPKDRFIVRDEKTRNTVWWGDVNIPFESANFDFLEQKMCTYLNRRQKVYVRDAYAGASEAHQISIRVISETAYQNLFSHHLFIRKEGNLPIDKPDWTIIAARNFEAVPEIDGTKQKNFAIINFTKRMILVGGTGYTGEIKKGIFSVLNFILPHEKNVLSMHCSANVGQEGDTALFFGLSGTGKTTLSADESRALVGDDEHGWDGEEVFNFEGGCYAKCVDLSPEKEPQIYQAIRFGALLENTCFYERTRDVDFANISKTENTRVAYPLNYISNARIPSRANSPQNIFFLTADASGVLPPIAKLSIEQAMYHFVSGYTAKLAGTETDVLEPKKTFSACFGSAFLPLHPMKYAQLLGEKLKDSDIKVWLVNTGWTGGAYGEGKRIPLKYTRAMITAAINGSLSKEEFEKEQYFNLNIPKKCEGVPYEILNPSSTWKDKDAYALKAKELQVSFTENMKRYATQKDLEEIGEPGI